MALLPCARSFGESVMPLSGLGQASHVAPQAPSPSARPNSYMSCTDLSSPCSRRNRLALSPVVVDRLFRFLGRVCMVALLPKDSELP